MTALAIGILSDTGSWINQHLPTLLRMFREMGHAVEHADDVNGLSGGDICFYLSVSRIIGPLERGKYRHNLIVHESDLPKGRGWSPMSWQILEGANSIPVTLLEAADKVDSGEIYAQKVIELNGTELSQEWRTLQARATIDLCVDFVRDYPRSAGDGHPQSGKPSYYARRTLADSRIDPERSIADQFDLMRVVDNDRYPAHFDYRGRRYILKIEPVDDY